MATIKRLINDYGEILDFNRNVAVFFLDNEQFLKKHDQRNYSSKTLLSELPSKITVKIGIKYKKLKIALVENEKSETDIILNGAEIHCIADDDKELFFGFSMKLLLGNENTRLDFTIANMKPAHTDYRIKPARLNYKKRMISDPNGMVIIFSSRADFEKVIDFCRQTIQNFNEHLPTDNKLVANVNF